jgi:hypothetical protein
MPLAWYALVLVALYVGRWSVNPLRSRVSVLRRVLFRPLPSRYTGDTLLQVVIGAGRLTGSQSVDDDEDPRWELEWNLLGPLVTTTALNELPARLVRSLVPGQRRSLARFYDVAIIWAVLGLALCLVVLLWEATGTTRWLWSTLRLALAPAEPQLASSLAGVKRSPVFPTASREMTSMSSSAVIQPLVGPTQQIAGSEPHRN